MNKQTITGCLLIVAAIGFWISWFLMPDPGTTDTIHILKIVKQERMNVMGSVITQIITSIVYVISLFLLMRLSFPQKRATLTGIILLGIGMLGLCSGAFFHLLAWFMTDDSVNIQEDVVRVMDFMQTAGVVFLIPLLLPIFIGGLLLAIGLNKQRVISKKSKLIIIAAFLIGILITIANKIQIYQGPVPVLAILGVFAIGQAVIGLELITRSKRLLATTGSPILKN